MENDEVLKVNSWLIRLKERLHDKKKETINMDLHKCDRKYIELWKITTKIKIGKKLQPVPIEKCIRNYKCLRTEQKSKKIDPEREILISIPWPSYALEKFFFRCKNCEYNNRATNCCENSQKT